jgi:hypothetical protein
MSRFKVQYLSIGLGLCLAACQVNGAAPTLPSPLQPKSPLVSTKLAAAATAGTADPAGLVTALPKLTPLPLAMVAGQLVWQQGKLTAGQVAIYQFEGQAGQQVDISVLSPENQAQLVLSGVADQLPLHIEANQAWAGSLPRTQTYQISVLAGTQPIDYLLKVSLQPTTNTVVTALPAPQEQALFVAGTSQANLQIALPGFGVSIYHFTAQAGQSLQVQLQPAVPFSITDASGEIYAIVNDAIGVWQGNLPRTQSYTLSVGGLAEPMNISLQATLR